MDAIYKNDEYEVVISFSPGPHSYTCYGVQNLHTGVIEAYVGQLAKAIYVADNYRDELINGLESEVESRVQAMIKAVKGYEPPTGGHMGGLN